MNKKMNYNLLKTLVIFTFLMSAYNYNLHGQLKVKPLPDHDLVKEIDRQFIKKVYQIARNAGEENYPYGALLVHDGKIIAECGNKVKEKGDVTMHAETGLISDASKKFSAQVLTESILYTSTEPCIMCSGAIFWAGIEKIVYGTTELNARLLFDSDAEKKLISSREAFKRIRPDVKIIGPVLEEEGLIIHDVFSRNN